MKSKRSVKTGSLFSGCGGFDLGFLHAGFDVKWACDIDPDACETYRHNIGDIFEGDVRDLNPSGLSKIDVLTAGFPCQPFSNAGSRRGVHDVRGGLFEETFRFIEEIRPRFVIFENVRGILSFKNKDENPLFNKILSHLETEYGYRCAFRLINFRHFGVPQNRIRVVAICTTEGDVDPDQFFPDITVNKDLTIKTTLKGITSRTPNQKEVMRLNPQALHYGSMIPEGGSWKSLPYDVLPERWKKIRDNMVKYHYPNFFRRYHRNDTMGTVTAAFKPENAAVWHPTKDRIYSVREIARFQTFPDDFEFMGRTIKSKYSQIGNAVPPHFFSQVAERLKLYIDGDSNSVPVYEYISSRELNVNQCTSKQLNLIEQHPLTETLSKAN